MQDVTVVFQSQTLSELDEIAIAHHNGDRDEAVEELLDEWLATRRDLP